MKPLRALSVPDFVTCGTAATLTKTCASPSKRARCQVPCWGAGSAAQSTHG